MDRGSYKMVKSFILLIILKISLLASVYSQNCVPCHKKESLSLEKLFYEYLLVYSSEIETKYAISEYLKNPKKADSILSEKELKKYNIKSRTKLSNEELKDAIDEYWQIYKVFGKLK